MFKRFTVYSLLIATILSLLVSCVKPPDTGNVTGNNTTDTQQGTQDQTGKNPEKKLDLSCLKVVSERRKDTLVTSLADIRFSSSFQNETTLRTNSVRFPLLTSEKIGAKGLNSKLEQMFKENYSDLETYDGGHKSSAEYTLNVYYEYSYFAGVLSLIVVEEKTFSDKTVEKTAEFFAYDTVSDNEMNVSDMLSLFGVTKNELFAEAASYLPEGDIIGVSMLLDGSFAVYCGTDEVYSGMFYSVPFDCAHAKGVLKKRFDPLSEVIADVYYKLPETDHSSRFMICAPSFERKGAKKVRESIIDWFYDTYSSDIEKLAHKFYEKLTADNIMFDISGVVLEAGDILTYKISDSSATCSGTMGNSEKLFYYDRKADIGIKDPVSAEVLIQRLNADEFTSDLLKYYSDHALGEELSASIDLTVAFKDENGGSFGVRLSYDYYDESYPHAFDYNEFVFGKALEIFSSLGAARFAGTQVSSSIEEKDILYVLEAKGRSNKSENIFTSYACVTNKALNTVKADPFYYDGTNLCAITMESYVKLLGEDIDALKQNAANDRGIDEGSFTVSYVFINEYNNDAEIYGVADGSFGHICRLSKPMPALEKLENERDAHDSEVIVTSYEKEFYTLKSNNVRFKNVFRVPQILGNKKNTDSVNNKIRSDFDKQFSKFIEEYGASNEKKTDIGGFYSYDYIYEEGIIAVECRYAHYDFSVSDAAEVKKKYYYYDTLKECEITAEQYNTSSLLAKSGMLTDLSAIADIIGNVVISDSGMVRTLFEFTINAPVFAFDGQLPEISSRVMIPFINSDRPGAVALNKKIVSDLVRDHGEIITVLLGAERIGKASGNDVYELSYTYRVEGCYIVIERVNACASLPDGYSKDVVSYYYDYENDIILSKLPNDTEDYLKLPISELKADTLSSVAESLISSDIIVFPVKNKKYKAVEKGELVRIELTIPCVNGELHGADLINDKMISDILDSLERFSSLDETHKLADINVLEEIGEPFGYAGHTFDEKNKVLAVDYLKPGKSLSDAVFTVMYLDTSAGKIITGNEYLAMLGETETDVVSELEEIGKTVDLLGNSVFASDAILKYSRESNGDLAVYMRHGSGKIVKVLLERSSDDEKQLNVNRADMISSVQERAERLYVCLDAGQSLGKLEDLVWRYVYHRVPELRFSSADSAAVNEKIQNKFNYMYGESVKVANASYEDITSGVEVMNYRYSRIGDLLVLTLIEETISAYGFERTYEHIYYNAATHKLMTYDEFRSLGDCDDAADMFDVASSKSSNELYIYIATHLENVLKENVAAGEVVIPSVEFHTAANGKLHGDHVSVAAVNGTDNGINKFNMTLLTEFLREYEHVLRDFLANGHDDLSVMDIVYTFTEHKGYISIVRNVSFTKKENGSTESKHYYFDMKRNVQISESDAYVLDNSFEPDIDGIIAKTVNNGGAKVKQGYGKEFFVYYSGNKYVVNYFHFPVLNSDTENARNFNRKLLTVLFDKHLGYINKYSILQRTEPTSFMSSVDYEYSVRDNIVIISIESRRFLFDESESDTKYSFYYYDLENDRELSTEEYLSDLGVSSESVLNELNSGRLTGFTTGEYGGLYKFKLTDLDGVVPFDGGGYDIYLKTSDDESTIKISYPPSEAGEWNAFPIYSGIERRSIHGLHFIHKNWIATKRSCVFNDVVSDNMYKLYDVGNEIVCIYYSKQNYSGFVLYDLSSAETLYVYDNEVTELLKSHGIDFDDYAGSRYLDINVESVTSYMVVCSYDFGIIFDNGELRNDVSLKGRFAASVYTGETVFYPGSEAVKLSEVNFLASGLDRAEGKEDLERLAEETAQSLSLGEITYNSYTDENGGIHEYVAGGVTFAYEEVKLSADKRETALSLTVAENIEQLLPHGIKLGDNPDDVLSAYGYDVKASDVSSLTYIDGTVLDETRAYISFDEGGYYLVWEKVTEKECRRIMLGFNETDKEEEYPLSYVQYLLIRF